MTWARFYFKLVAVIFIGFAVVAVIAPDQYLSLLNVDASVGGRLWGRAFGAASLGLGGMFWLINPVAQRRERRIGAIAAAVVFGATGMTDIVSVVSGDLPPYGWGFVAFNTVMVVLAVALLRGGSRAVPDREGV